MKKIPSLILVLVLLSACSTPQNQQIKEPDLPQANQAIEKTYQEIETSLIAEKVEEFDIDEEVDQEIERLKKIGQVFWHEPNTLQRGWMQMDPLERHIECKNGIKSKENCSITGLTSGSKLSEEFELGDCEVEPYSKRCFVIKPTFPKELINKFVQEAGFYAWKGDFYSIGAMNKDDVYVIYKNNDEIFSDKMYFGTESVVSDFGIVNDNLTFTYNDLDHWEDENHPIVTSNIYYQGETLNEKYGLKSSFYPFGYSGKIGFIAKDKETDKPFFYFNGQKISENFDVIRPYGCCTASSYPIEVDENGILFFMAKRGEKYYFVEVNLNKYL